MNLFQLANFTSHSGKSLDWKIECDALTDDDWRAVADIIGKKMNFAVAMGIPTGGEKLAQLLIPYAQPQSSETILIVDDVLTTGGSMEEFRKHFKPGTSIIGVVVFSRMPHHLVPAWIKPVFQLGEDF